MAAIVSSNFIHYIIGLFAINIYYLENTCSKFLIETLIFLLNNYIYKKYSLSLSKYSFNLIPFVTYRTILSNMDLIPKYNQTMMENLLR